MTTIAVLRAMLVGLTSAATATYLTSPNCAAPHSSPRMSASLQPVSFRSAISATTAEWRVGVDGLLRDLQGGARIPDLAVVFVPMQHAAALDDVCTEVARGLGSRFTVGCVAAGVAGAGVEVEGCLLYTSPSPRDS